MLSKFLGQYFDFFYRMLAIFMKFEVDMTVKESLTKKNIVKHEAIYMMAYILGILFICFVIIVFAILILIAARLAA